jgi:hypothetical protein
MAELIKLVVEDAKKFCAGNTYQVMVSDFRTNEIYLKPLSVIVDEATLAKANPDIMVHQDVPADSWGWQEPKPTKAK